jgi:hypothetical protein
MSKGEVGQQDENEETVHRQDLLTWFISSKAAYGEANCTWEGPVEIKNENKRACSVGLTFVVGGTR